jgi:hypothetical protein
MFPSRDVAMPLTVEDVCDTADLLVPFTPFLLLLPLLISSKTRGVAITILLHFEMKIFFFDMSDYKRKWHQVVDLETSSSSENACPAICGEVTGICVTSSVFSNVRY